MSTPCPICGRLTEPHYAFCRSCGHPIAHDTAAPVADSLPEVPAVPSEDVTEAQPAPVDTAEQPVEEVGPQPVDEVPLAEQPPVIDTDRSGVKKEKNLPGLLIGIGAVLVMIGIAITLVFLSKGGEKKPASPQEVLDQLIDASLSSDYEKVFDCIYEYHYSAELRQSALRSVSDDADMSAEDLGIDKNAVKSLVSFKVTGQEPVGPQDDEKIRQTLTQEGVTTEPIETIVRTTISVSLFGSQELIDLFFVKADGSWYLLMSNSYLAGPDQRAPMPSR